MKLIKLLPLYLLFALLCSAPQTRAQAAQELQVPMSQSAQYSAPSPTYQGMQSTSPYNSEVSRQGSPVGTTAEVKNMYRTTYETQNMRTKRKLGDDDEDGDDAGDGKDDIDQPGDIFPLGSGLWMLIFLALAYCAFVAFRRKEDD